MQDFDFSCKCVLVGNSCVGKTSIVSKFIDPGSQIHEPYRITIGVEFGVKTLMINGKKIKIYIWDTGGQERFRSITRAYYRNATSVIFVFDVTDRNSFDSLHQWIIDAKYATHEPHMLLIGNKSDLNDQRVISTVEALKFATDNRMDYIETSAKNGSNITDYPDKCPFNIITSNILKRIENKEIDPMNSVHGIKYGLSSNKKLIKLDPNIENKHNKYLSCC